MHFQNLSPSYEEIYDSWKIKLSTLTKSFRNIIHLNQHSFARLIDKNIPLIHKYLNTTSETTSEKR